MSSHSALQLVFAGFMAVTVAGVQAAPQDGPAKMAKTNGHADQFSAVAVNIEAPAGMAAIPIDILVERYSTPAERDLVYNTMMEAPKQLLNVIQKLPRVGAIRGASSIGWDLKYAWRIPGPNNTERVTIITDRPISFGEAANQSRTIDYPFTVIELRIGSNGRGEGRMSIGTKVSADKETKSIILENFNATAVMLNDVRREK